MFSFGIIDKDKENTHLILPDSHARPGFSNERYDWLSELIQDIKPTVVVDIGDFYDMESLSSYDKGKKAFEGRRYKKDIEVGIEAQDRILGPLRKAKKKLPRFVRTLGNHEDRINRLINISPEFEGIISTKDLQSKDYLWEEHDYGKPVEIDGVHYCHTFPSGTMGKPIGGENIGRMLIQKKHVSCTQGHSHVFDYAVRSTIKGDKLMGLSVGCYFGYEMDYAGPTNNMYDRGVVIKRNVNKGVYELQWISYETLKKTYRKR